MARPRSLLAMLVCVALLVVVPESAVGIRRRSTPQGGLIKSGNSWRCARKDLNGFLGQSTSLDIVGQSCLKTGEMKLSCYMVSAQFPDVPISVDVLCGRRKGWKQATLADSSVALGDASTAQIVIDGISAANVNDDDTKQRIVDELNRIADAQIFSVEDIFIHKIADSAIVTFSVVTDASLENCYAANLANVTSFVNCANCAALGTEVCPTTTTSTVSSTFERFPVLLTYYCL